jgi:multimeric flavodoxin WrbA
MEKEVRMKALGIVGSHRTGGNTEQLMSIVLETIAEENIEVELLSLAGKDIRSCTACMACKGKEVCSIDDDLFPIYLKMKEADAVIIGSPVYFQGPTALVRALIERAGYISNQNGLVFTGKVGAPLVVTRRSGMSLSYAQLLLWFTGQRFFIPGSTGIAIGREKGEVLKDEEGVRIASEFGKRTAFLLRKLFK